MSRIPIPLSVSRQISELAVRRARESMQRRNWSQRAQGALQPSADIGKVGIRTTVNYLMFQEKGFGPFLMTSLEGKTVPIKGRFYRVKGVGLPGMGYQDRKYDPVRGPVWRAQRWRHPGIRPERFMQNAISRAILESRATLLDQVMHALSGGDTNVLRQHPHQ